MLRESSISTPRKFCCGTAALRISVGRNRQKSSTRERGEAQADEHHAIARRSTADTPRYVSSASHRDRRHAG